MSKGDIGEYVHVCIDDASRVAFVQVMPDQRKQSAIAFLKAGIAYLAKLGVQVERVMTDNGSCYRSKAFRAAFKRLGLRLIFTKPYTPKADGKAERFIQTVLYANALMLGLTTAPTVAGRRPRRKTCAPPAPPRHM